MNEIILRNLVTLSVTPGRSYNAKDGSVKYAYATVICQCDNSSTITASFDDRKFKAPVYGELLTVTVRPFCYNNMGRFSCNITNLELLS